MRKSDSLRESHEGLLRLIKSSLPRLEQLWAEHVIDNLAEENLVYRYYHESLKVYWIQEHTEAIVSFFKELAVELGKELGCYQQLNEAFSFDRSQRYRQEVRALA